MELSVSADNGKNAFCIIMGTPRQGGNAELETNGNPYREFERVFLIVQNTKIAANVVSQKVKVIETVISHSFNSRRPYVVPDDSLRIDNMLLVEVFSDTRALSNL